MLSTNRKRDWVGGLVYVLLLLALVLGAVRAHAAGTPESPEPKEPATPQKIFDILVENVRYTPEPEGLDVVQPPVYTIRVERGDCEDIALLYVQLLYEFFGYEGYLAVLEFLEDPSIRHMVVWEKYNSVFQDPTYGWQKTRAEIETEWRILGYYTRAEMLLRAYHPENLALLARQGGLP